MKNFALCLMLALGAASLCGQPATNAPPAKAPVTKSASEVVLEVKGGGVKTVEVERQVIIKVPVEVVTSFPFIIEGDPELGLYFWTAPGASVIDLGNVLEISSAPKGDLTVSAKIIDKIDGKWVTKFGRKTVSIGAPSPVPPPDPPKPPPDPKPPGPDGTSPFAEAGFRVMISFDQTNTTRPAAEQSVIYGKAVRDYLEAKCIPNTAGEKDGSGRPLKEYRIFPANTDVSRVRPVFRDAWAKKGGPDWILVGDGKTGHSGPLPKSEAEAMILLRKFGGE